MFDFHEKRKIRGILYSKPVIGVLLLCTVFLGNAVYHRYTIAKEMRNKLEIKRNELTELESRAAALESKVEYLKDERGIEEELRNRFDVAKNGERVIILVDEAEKMGTGTAVLGKGIPPQGREDSEDDGFLPNFLNH